MSKSSPMWIIGRLLVAIVSLMLVSSWFELVAWVPMSLVWTMVRCGPGFLTHVCLCFNRDSLVAIGDSCLGVNSVGVVFTNYVITDHLLAHGLHFDFYNVFPWLLGFSPPTLRFVVLFLLVAFSTSKGPHWVDDVFLVFEVVFSTSIVVFTNVILRAFVGVFTTAEVCAWQLITYSMFLRAHTHGRVVTFEVVVVATTQITTMIWGCSCGGHQSIFKPNCCWSLLSCWWLLGCFLSKYVLPSFLSEKLHVHNFIFIILLF